METRHGNRFWLGNAILAVALVILLFMGTLWQQMGVFAMVLWVAVAGLGAYLLSTDKGDDRQGPD